MYYLGETGEGGGSSPPRLYKSKREVSPRLCRWPLHTDEIGQLISPDQ